MKNVKNLPIIHTMEKYIAFISLLLPQLMLAQAGGIGAEHGLRAGDISGFGDIRPWTYEEQEQTKKEEEILSDQYREFINMGQ